MRILTTALTIGVLLLLCVVVFLYRRRSAPLGDLIAGLPSRDYFERFLRHCAARAARHPDYGFGVLLLDIGGFATLRKSLGRSTADGILADCASRMFWVIRPTDVLTRLADDRFAILLEDVRRVTDATRVALRVQSSMTEAVTLASRGFPVTVSVGVTISRPDAMGDALALMHEAQTALARAVESGRPYVVFDTELDARAVEDAAFEMEVTGALDAGQLRLGFQPVVSPASGALAGFSSVLQWQHPERGLLAARQFIHLTENSREILRIGAWVLNEAAGAAAALNAAAQRPLLLSVNVGETELEHGDVIGTLASALNEHRSVAQSLRIELPASTLTSSGPQLEALVEDLRALGVGVHVDQAETAGIPLWRASRLRGTGVRLNARTIGTADTGALLLLIGACRALVEEVVVEAVEDAATYRVLQTIEPPVLVQGYLIAQPMSLEQALAYTERGEAFTA